MEDFRPHEHDDSCEPIGITETGVTYTAEGQIRHFMSASSSRIAPEVLHSRVADALGLDPSQLSSRSESGSRRGGKTYGVSNWAGCSWVPVGPRPENPELN